MPVLFAIVCFAVMIWFISASAKRRRSQMWADSGMGAARPNELRGRALVLKASRQSTLVTTMGGRYESRSMTLDVEVPGLPPFQTSGVFRVPRGIVEAISGASLEVSVDPNNPSSLEVLGPGGFSGPWLQYGPPNAY
jgi:hypothetical protein